MSEGLILNTGTELSSSTDYLLSRTGNVGLEHLGHQLQCERLERQKAIASLKHKTDNLSSVVTQLTEVVTEHSERIDETYRLVQSAPSRESPESVTNGCGFTTLTRALEVIQQNLKDEITERQVAFETLSARVNDKLAMASNTNGMAGPSVPLETSARPESVPAHKDDSLSAGQRTEIEDLRRILAREEKHSAEERSRICTSVQDVAAIAAISQKCYGRLEVDIERLSAERIQGGRRQKKCNARLEEDMERLSAERIAADDRFAEHAAHAKARERESRLHKVRQDTLIAELSARVSTASEEALEAQLLADAASRLANELARDVGLNTHSMPSSISAQVTLAEECQVAPVAKAPANLEEEPVSEAEENRTPRLTSQTTPYSPRSTSASLSTPHSNARVRKPVTTMHSPRMSAADLRAGIARERELQKPRRVG